KAFLLEQSLDFDLAQPLAFEIGQLQVLEHQVDQFIQTDISLVIIDPRFVAGLLAAFAVLALADDVAGFGLAVAALTDAGGVVTVDEAIFFYSANRHFDYPILIFTDDRFLGDDIGDVVANRFANFLLVAQPVAGSAIATLAGRGVIGTKNR